MRIQFEKTLDGVRTAVRPGVQFQGFDGVLQGGVVAGLLDDAMWYAALAAAGTMTMTAELTVRYKAPVPVDASLTVTGRVVGHRRNLFTCTAAIAGPDEVVLAEGFGKFLTAPPSLAAQLQASMT